MRCSICAREFDERGYQLVVPRRTESFDSFECAARAQGMPWLGPRQRAHDDDLAPFEQPSAPHADQSASSFLVPQLGLVRARAALVGAAALLVSVTTASAYVFVRDDAKTSADRPASPGAAVPPSGEALRPLTGERSAEASGVSTEPRPARVSASRSEPRGAGRSAADAALLVSSADEPAKARNENGEDAGSRPHSPAPPVSPPARGSRPESPPVRPPRSPAPDPPRPAAPPAPVADAVTAATRPGWGHGDKNHVHEGPPGPGATNPHAGKKPRAPRRPRRR